MSGEIEVLYVVYWGALEPLGRALVLPVVERLATLGARITLVTYEKPADLARAADVRGVEESLHSAGVRWIPLRYHKSPKVPATLFDVAHGAARGVLERRRVRPDLIHARTFIGGLTGLALARLTGAKLVYHNEGFYPDEQVDAGFWQEGSTPHRTAKALELRLYRRADAVFSLSRKGKDVIESLDGVRGSGKPVAVVPSCVDLDHFRAPAGEQPDTTRFVYMGSVGGRYLVDRIGRFVAVAREAAPDTELDVLTPMEPAIVRSALAETGLPDSAWSSRFVDYDRLPGELAGHSAGFCFHTHTLSAAGGSSTKVGQYWAVGMPVVATAGLGDVDDIIRQERVGVVVPEHSDDRYRAALGELQSLLKDPGLAARCRAAAQRHYGLEEACATQMAVYRELAGG